MLKHGRNEQGRILAVAGGTTSLAAAVFYSALPGGRGHGRIPENRPYTKNFGRGKLVAVKVAVSGSEWP
jgi:hypothetical protein